MKNKWTVWLDYVKCGGTRGFLHKLWDKDVLDIGCGDALYLYNKEKWCGVDINPDVVKNCKAKGYNVVYGTCEDIPFPEESFDAILAFQLVEHLTPNELVGLFKEASRLLRENGEIYITTPVGAVWDTVEHTRPYTPTAIMKLLSDPPHNAPSVKGFKVEYVFYPSTSSLGGLIANLTPFLGWSYFMKITKVGDTMPKP